MRAHYAITSAIVAMLVTTSALAQQRPEERTAQPLWEIGAAGLAASQQAYPGAMEQVNRGLALPTLIYRGQYLRASESGASVRAIKTPTFELDVGLTGSFGSGNRDIAARRGMARLGTMVEFGPRLKWNLWRSGDGASLRAEFPVRGVFDLSNGFTHRGIAFEPELQVDLRNPTGWSYKASVGALSGSRRLNETFYGVAPADATAVRPAYGANAGLIGLRLSGGVTRQLGPDWFLFVFGRIDDVRLGKNEASPLVQKKTGGSFGVALSTTWQRSASMAYH